MMRLRFADKELSEFLALCLSSHQVKRRIWSMGRPAVAQLSINQRELGQFLVALPDKSERKEIVEILKTNRNVELKLEAELTALGRLKKSLLQNLLTGKVRVKV